MRMKTQRNRWSCLLSSFAMCLDRDEKVIESIIGHDGSEIIWPQLPEPLRRRSFHIMELIRVAYIYDYGVIPFSGNYEVFPTTEMQVSKKYDMPVDYFDQIIERNQGVFTGLGPSGSRHAVAWDGRLIYDPTGGVVYSKERFSIEMFWAVVPLK